MKPSDITKKTELEGTPTEVGAIAPIEGPQGGDPTSEAGDTSPKSPAKRNGRPSNKALQAKKPGGRGKVGRPKGDAAIMNDYKSRMLASPKSRKVMAKVFEAALDDEHKHQAICMKMIMDRVAPVGAFEADVKKGKAAGGINITITGVGQATVGRDIEASDAEWEEVDSADS
jgi:hypothetical protein